DLEDSVALPSRSDDMVDRTASVVLLQTVLDVERLAGERREVNDYVRALSHAEPDALDLDRLRQEVAVTGGLPELVMGVEVAQIGQEELIEARRPTVEPAEAVSARTDVQYGLDLAVHQELVAEDTVQVEKIEEQQPGPRIEALVGEHHGDIELGEAREMEASGLVPRVELVKEEVEPGQALVDVLSGEVDTVIVIPEGAHGFVDVAGGLVIGEDSSKYVGIVLVIEAVYLEEVAGVAVALRRRVAVVKMGRYGRKPEPAV